MRILIVLLLKITFPIYTYGQIITFEKEYGGFLDEEGYAIKECNTYGYIIAGITGSYGMGGLDIYAIRIDDYGDTIWTKTYGTIFNDYCQNVVQTNDNGFAFFGWVQSEDTLIEPGGLYILKTDSSGNQEWFKRYNIYPHLTGGYGQQTSDGGYVIAGPCNLYPRNAVVIKTDNSGEISWVSNTGTSNEAVPLKVFETSQGDFIINGWMTPCGPCQEKGLITKISATGDSLWSSLIDNGIDAFNMIQAGVEFEEDNYVFTSMDNTFINLIKINADGQVTHQYLSGETEIGNAQVFDIKTTPSGNYVFTGNCEPNKIFLAEADTTGAIIWHRKFGEGLYADDSYSVIATQDGGYVIGGTKRDSNNNLNQVHVIKTDELGMLNSINGHVLNKQYIYPNPLKSQNNLYFNNPQNNQYKAIITNNIGYEFSEIVNGNTISIVENLSKGIYWLTLYDIQGKLFLSQKIIIL